MLIAATGLRTGEALALRWQDVDLDAGMLTVRGTVGRIGGRLVVSEPKTDRSRRVVPLAPPWWRCCGPDARSRPPKCGQATSGRLGSGVHHRIRGPVDPRNLLRVG